MKKCQLVSSVIIFFLVSSLFSTPAIASTPRQTLPSAIFDCTTITDIPPSECDALLALYVNTDGANWTNKTNWFVTTTADDWYGVTVTSGHVTILNLSFNNLNGTIPTDLGNLANLIELYLHYNNLTGSIPASLGGLSSLTALLLYNNQLSGAIPPELGDLSALTNLSLSQNALSGSIPTELGKLSNLYYLSLRNNQLSGSIPTSLGSLTNMLYLELSGNLLDGAIPVELANLSNLRELSLEGNSLTGNIPPQLGSLSNLYHLHLYSNKLEGQIPPELGNLSNLQYLNLGDNDLTGSIPPELGNLTQLTGLHIFDTGISGSIPSQLGNLANLQWMSLYQNSLSGNLPATFTNLDNLFGAYLQDNQLTGSIPPEMGGLEKLQDLWLENNDLSGSIPAELGALSELRRLHLQLNDLTGSVPTSFTNLTKMTEFYFHDTTLCEPATSAYQAWKAAVTDYQGTGLSCSVLSPVDEEKLTSSKVTFVWNPVTDAAKYKLQLSTKDDFSTLIISIKTTTNTYPYLTSLVSGKTYYWRVCALVFDDWTDWDSHRFYSMDPLAAPILASPANAALLALPVSLSWDPVTNAAQYQLQVARDADFSDQVFKGKLVDTFKEFSDLAPGKYYWRVKAIEAGGLKGPWSELRLFTVVKVFPPVLTSPANEAFVDPALILTWDPAEDAVKYKLQVAKDATFTNLIVNENTTELSKALTGLKARGYFWRVRAIDADGFKSPWSIAWKFTVVATP